MIDGKALAKAIINKFECRDSRDQIHVPHGIFTLAASRYAHVCFDRHPNIGRKCWFGRLDDLQIYILVEQIKPKIGSLPGSEIRNTGSGYGIDPIRSPLKSFGIDPFNIDLEETDTAAVGIVKRWLEHHGYNYRHATVEEQKTGIDLMPIKEDGETWEVKSRFSPSARYGEIFVQLGETNPNGLH